MVVHVRRQPWRVDACGPLTGLNTHTLILGRSFRPDASPVHPAYAPSSCRNRTAPFEWAHSGHRTGRRVWRPFDVQPAVSGHDPRHTGRLPVTRSSIAQRVTGQGFGFSGPSAVSSSSSSGASGPPRTSLSAPISRREPPGFDVPELSLWLPDGSNGISSGGDMVLQHIPKAKVPHRLSPNPAVVRQSATPTEPAGRQRR